ncbi:hypothetical protein PAI11_43260 [Patulibacter medicamentivorans]|uniref:Uncharacterized protein n=1 Tax=Patulibacter medicamentivorans TaxID=1097667 RepID=H0EBU3_9ACTN|nr:hypothetical protein PAI11_43260 [Patulibacter medicamentivorans]
MGPRRGGWRERGRGAARPHHRGWREWRWAAARAVSPGVARAALGRGEGGIAGGGAALGRGVGDLLVAAGPAPRVRCEEDRGHGAGGIAGVRRHRGPARGSRSAAVTRSRHEGGTSRRTPVLRAPEDSLQPVGWAGGVSSQAPGDPEGGVSSPVRLAGGVNSPR